MIEAFLIAAWCLYTAWAVRWLLDRDVKRRIESKLYESRAALR